MRIQFFSIHFVFAFIVLLQPQAAGQQPEMPRFALSGRVINAATNEGLPGASVFIPNTEFGLVTDASGSFTLHLKSGTYLLVARLIGFKSDSAKVQLNAASQVTLRLQPEDVELEEVTVRGKSQEDQYLTRSNQSLTTLSEAEVDKHRGQTLGETLQQIPGVTVLQTGPSISKPVIRGLHSDRVLVLNAGVPQEGQQWGGEHAPEIDPFSASRIEVLKGAAGVAYGAGAIGGVIRIEPKPLREIPGIAGQLSLNGFSNNLQGAGSVFLEGSHDFLPGFAWQAQLSMRKAGNSRTPDYDMGNTGFSEFVASLTAGYHTESGGFKVYYNNFNTELGIYKGSHIGNLSDLDRALASGRPLSTSDFTYKITPPEQKITHELWSIWAEHFFRSVGRIELQVGRQSNHRQEFDSFRFFNNVQSFPTQASFDLTLTTYTVDVKFEHAPIGNVYGTIGLSGMRQGNVRAGSAFLIPNFRSYSGSAYIVEEWTKDQLTLNTGIRYDYRWLNVFPYEQKNIPETELTYSNVSGVIGALYRLSLPWSLGVNVGTAFRPPSVNELYSDGVHHGTAQYERGDPNLKNERSYSIDVTLRHQSESVKAELSGYYNFLENFIFLFPNPQPTVTLRGVFPSFSYQQAHCILRGLDGSIEYQLANFDYVGANISLVRGDNLDADEPLFQMPSDRLRITNTFLLPSGGAFDHPSLGLSATFTARQNRYPKNVDYVDPPAGYLVVDLDGDARIAMGSQSIRASFTISNLSNTRYRNYLSRYRYYLDDAGINIILRVQVPFGT